MRDNELLYWIWLSEKLGPANRRTPGLLERFGSVFEIYRADAEQLVGIDRDSNERLAALEDKSLEEANRIIRACDRLGVEIIPYGSDRYPDRLAKIQDPPTVLYCRGLIPNFNDLLCIGVVGTRKMSEYGCRAAYKITYGLAASGVVTVSGMALGIDGVAACATFAARGHSVAVLGGGIDVIYPRNHRAIYNELLRHGTVMSEYPPGYSPSRYTFPQRNRIISGLSQGTFVVEGDVGSGAMITARDALVQGRELFALPGNVGEANSNGTNSMIREGAHPVTCSGDILREFLPLYSGRLAPGAERSHDAPDCDYGFLKKFGIYTDFGRETPEKKPAPPVATSVAEERAPEYPDSEVRKKTRTRRDKNAPEPEKKKSDGTVKEYDDLEPSLKAVYDCIPQDRAVPVDKIKVDGVDVGGVIAALTMLELRGLVESLPGGLYSRT